MAWLSGWRYRKKITISNNGNDLTDYQIAIDLDSNNFDFSKANSDGSDIRFTSDDGQTLLSYWIEEWNSENSKAKVWVKVPSIPASSSTDIYMYYGNANAQSESNPEAVFDFWDDFNGDSLDTNKWGTGGYISTSVADSILTVQGTSDSSWGRITTTQRFSRQNGGLILDTKMKVDSDSAYYNAGLDDRLYDGSKIGSGIDRATMSIETTKIWKTEREYSHTDYTRTIDPTQWGVMTIKWATDYVDFLWNYEQDCHATSNIPQDPLCIRTDLKGSGKTLYFDWVRLRKFADPEPSYTIGSEEASLKYWDGSAWQNIKSVKYWDGSAWQTVKAVYRWDGSEWVKVW